MHEDFSPQESLRLIQAMIDKTKSNMSENRFYFLLWGWVALTGILGQFFMKVVLHYPRHYLSWLILFPAVLITIIHSARHVRKAGSRTYVGDAMRYLWTGMGITFFVLSFIITFLPVGRAGWQLSYPFFILLYGLGTFVSGRILQFPPFVIGGIFNWLLAAAAVFFPFDYQLLFAAAAIITSYLIPSYLIKESKEKNYAGTRSV